MNHSFKFSLLIICFFLNLTGYVFAQEKGKTIVYITETDKPDQIIKKAAHVVPSPRQLEWQKLEYNAFVHLGLYTFPKPRGVPASPDLFNPVDLDCRQWVKAFKEAGMKGVILTAKHHEGFCLWPSKYTDYSVKSSKWRNGQGDVVKELSQACREYGLKLGIYLSPWDLHNPDYGTPKYDDYFKNQLTELLTNYGEIFEVWFDGYYGGPGGELKKNREYDWKGYVDLVQKLQPDASIAITWGPDVRWVGTESGYGRDTEWSVIPAGEKDLVRIDSGSLRDEEKGGEFYPYGDMLGKDLGGREKIMKAKALVWYPSEVDVSIRPSWGYILKEDTLVKTPEKLMDIYYNSVGKNSLLLLNVPPDTRGLIQKTISGLIMYTTLRRTLSQSVTKQLITRSFHNINLYLSIKRNHLK